MGLEVLMDPGKGPVFPSPLLSPADMDTRLVFKPDVGARLRYMFDAITLTRRKAAEIHAVSCDPRAWLSGLAVTLFSV